VIRGRACGEQTSRGPASNLDLNLVGYFIVALFVITWGVAFAVWRYARIEERWSVHLQQP
jgi:hypothetical protein